MQVTPTSPVAVSKLKKLAKLLVRDNPALFHAQALNKVAKQAGYLHWKHVLECEHASSNFSALDGTTEKTFCTSNRQLSKRPELAVVSGASGSGKTVSAHYHAITALGKEKRVHILDFGRSYTQLCEMVGGTLIMFAEDGTMKHKTCGSNLLTVVDLEAVQSNNSAHLIELSTLVAQDGQGLLIVDEVDNVLIQHPLSSLSGLVAKVRGFGECQYFCVRGVFRNWLLVGFYSMEGPCQAAGGPPGLGPAFAGLNPIIWHPLERAA